MDRNMNQGLSDTAALLFSLRKQRNKFSYSPISHLGRRGRCPNVFPPKPMGNPFIYFEDNLSRDFLTKAGKEGWYLLLLNCAKIALAPK